MTEIELKEKILSLISDISQFDVEVIDVDFNNFSIYFAKLGFLTNKLDIKKRQIVFKRIHKYLCSIDDKVRLVGSTRHPHDFDMEIIVVEIKVNVCELKE